MDGNLLDPDNADATLAKEWSLPELPAGVEDKLAQTLKVVRKFMAECCVLFKAHLSLAGWAGRGGNALVHLQYSSMRGFV